MVSLARASLILLVSSAVVAAATPTPVSMNIPPVVWELVSFAEPTSASVTIADPSRFTLQFLPDGELVGQFDCNRGGSGYSAFQGHLAVTELRTTRRRCPSDSVAHEVPDDASECRNVCV